MKSKLKAVGLLLVFVLALVSSLRADSYLESLQPQQKVHGFRVLNLYDNSSGQAMGARFLSERYGFVIDLIQVQSVPQAFYWVKTPPISSKGEAHACEHLLLGKGNRGRYVATLEDMALGSSSAFTAQIRTCYHFNTIAGVETFYQIFEAKLQALLRPDFTDEEIRREVCHIGVTTDPQDSTLSIEEKGTVYTEMVSAFEKPWYHFYSEMNKLVYGENHPFSYCSGGEPAVMRTMVPADMWRFHRNYYHLATMGVVVSIPHDIAVDEFLKRMTGILERCQDYPDSSSLVGIGAYEFPPVKMAPMGTVKLTTYPSEKQEDPGYLMYGWPAGLEISFTELFLLELFLENFAGGETSNLYDLFINSQTRKLDLGGNYVFGGVDSDFGNSIYFGLTGIDNSHINRVMVDSIKAVIRAEIKRVYDFADGSEALLEFNKRAGNRLLQTQKQIDNYLNSPPMFGFRSGVGAGWVSLLQSLEREKRFRKSLVLADRFAYAQSLLALGDNIWKRYIDNWRLVAVDPYVVGASPSPEILTKAAEAKEARLTGYLEDFKKKYGVDDEQEAIARYKDEFAAKTAELEAVASKQELPGFIDNPPLTLDDQLNYEVITLPNAISLVASTFENMTSSKVGIALRLDVIPESLLVYVPYLPSILTEIGVIKEGEIVAFAEMRERLRRQVLSLDASFDIGYQSGRVELVLSGRGSNLAELKNALGWMDAALYSPYLTTDNLPRMMDVIDQSLIANRNRIRGSEENWVNSPANGYRFQSNPLIMTTGCFLTRIHYFQRLKWLLTDPGNADQQEELAAFLDLLADYGNGKNREELTTLLAALENIEDPAAIAAFADLNQNVAGLSDLSKKTGVQIAKALKVTLNDIPDASLAADWAYLCQEIKNDIMVEPEEVIRRINLILDLVRKTDNARMFMISNSSDREATLAQVKELAGKLDSETPSVRQQYANISRVVERLKQREPGITRPVYAGLVHEGTRNGVLIFSARLSGQYDTSSTAVRNCLAGKLYGGGGPHGLFMNTWAAGLAYSNGYSYRDRTGRVSYYAERCPDVAETMRFVVNLLKNAEDDPTLTDYAVAQAFGYSRAPSRYEQRGEAMASDLADGLTSDVVRTFRKKLLTVRESDNLYQTLKAHMEEAYGPVMIGYGAPLSESEDGSFFLIGPETQFESLENYIETVESKQTVYRLYPRDFWLTM